MATSISGRRVVSTPHAQLLHHESATKPGNYLWELDLFRERWSRRFPRDPYYNPNLSVRDYNYRLAIDE